MSKAILARRRGDDFQAYYFWKRACDMFLPTSQIDKIGFEVPDYDAFDDVAVLYRKAQPRGSGFLIHGDYLQIKYSVGYGKPITLDALMDPAFVNAKSTSFMQCLCSAVAKMQKAGHSHRFVLIAPWQIGQDDVLARLYRREDGGVNLDRLFDGTTIRGEMGRLRHRLTDRLNLENEDALKPILQRLRIECVHEDLETILRHLQGAMSAAGFVPVEMDKITDRYCQLPWSLLRQGRSWFDADDLEAVARNEGLWRGHKPRGGEGPRRLGIRSFMRWAEGMEDETDAMLCLCRHFTERHIQSPGLWNDAVRAEVSDFLRTQVTRGGTYILDLQALTSIAFCAGYLLEPKLNASISILQDRSNEPWVVRPSHVRNIDDRWVVSAQRLGGRDDVAVGISVSRPVDHDVLEYVRSAALPVHETVMLNLREGASQTALQSGTEAFALAQHAVNKIMQVRRAQGIQGLTHVFVAAPNAFSFFLGQTARVLGPIRLYEYAFGSGRPGAYTPSVDVGTDIRL